MSNDIETDASVTDGTIDPYRAKLAVLLIPSLLCLVGVIIAFLIFVLNGHLWLLWIPVIFVVLTVGVELFVGLITGNL